MAYFTVNHQQKEETFPDFDAGKCIFCHNLTSHGFEIAEDSINLVVNCCKRCELKFNKLDSRILHMLFENLKFYILKFGG